MALIQKETLTDSEISQIFTIWNTVYPVQLVYEDVLSFKRYLSGLAKAQHILCETDGKLDGWLCVFKRDGGNWFVIILDPATQGKGVGKRLMNYAIEAYRSLNGWVVAHDEYLKQDGSTYVSPLGFYQKLGLKVVEGDTLHKDGLECVRIVKE